MTLCFAFAGTPCPRLWDEDLVGNKYENVTGKEMVMGWLRRDGLCGRKGVEKRKDALDQRARALARHRR